MIFAFGPNESFYFNNGDKHYWQNLPQKLIALLTDDKHYKKAKHVGYLTLFPNNGWYILGEKTHLWEDLPEKVTAAINEIGAEARITNIEHDVTQPDRFFIGTAVKNIMYINDIPENCLKKAFRMGPLGGFTKVTLGYNGTWALQGPALNSFQLNNPEMDKHMYHDVAHIVNIMLSPYDDQYGFIEYHNGSFVYFLPELWHVHVDQLRHSKIHVVFNTVVQSEVFKAVVGKLEDEGKDALKGDISSALGN
ncbi:hypothetical protein FRB96_005271 [Tulasnella sp. 330]|nr:hypothetical protein FRB96_005271 [Tulasnella sp. 330]